MNDEDKTREDLILEMEALREKNRELTRKLLDLKHAERENLETLLVIDDNEETRKVIVKLLEEYRYPMLEADSAQKAISLFETHAHPIHLVLCDIVMPDMNGPELVLKLLKIRPEIKVIFMSGYAEDEIVHDDVFKVLHSSTSFIRKPFTVEEIGLIVRQQLDNTL